MCPHCRAFITTSDRVCPYCGNEVGPRAVDQRNPADAVGGLIPHARFVTSIILLMNLGLFAVTVLYSMRAGNGNALMDIDGRTLVEFGAKWLPGLVGGQWWRLITAGFLHGGLIHILMNSWVLFDLGAQVEEIYGWPRLIVFYIGATILGFYFSAVWTPAVSVGASAGLFGLIGAMIALGVRHRHHPLGAAIRGAYMRWAIYGLLFGILPWFRMDNAAHIGGLVAGFGIAYLANTPKQRDDWRERLWQTAAYICLALTALSFVKWYLWFTSLPAGVQ